MDRIIDGRYLILRELGSGGMGTVYEVRDQSNGRQLALKILAASGERQRERLMRFRREFRAASLLAHPCIVRVHDFVSARLSYFTMEYVEGKSLAAYFGLGERRLTPAELNAPERTRRLFSALHQICLALGYVHAQSIIHRDLKPENILVTDAPAEGHRAPRLKLMDFGLARDLKETVALTQPGTVLGTLSYVSPEQATGRAIDGRSDLYSLGVLLYLLLTGTVPFGTDKVSNILWKHCSQPPEPPRLRNPGVHRFLESLCLRLLVKDPFERFQTAAEVLRLVEKAGRGSYPLPDEVREHGARAEPATGQVFAPRLVGRDAELGALLATLDAASEGVGSVVTVVAAPGSGRGRLLAEAKERARAAGSLVLSARFDPVDPRPLQGLGPLFEDLARALGSVTDAEAAQLAGPESAQLAALDRRFTEVRAIARAAADGPAAPADPARQVRALAQLLQRLGRRAPIVLVLEELQAADERALALVGHLAREALLRSEPDPFATDPGLVIWLSSSPPAAELEASAVGERAVVIQLGNLGLAHSAMLLHSMLGQELPDAALAEQLWLASEGRPGELEELVRMAVAEGALRSENGRWTAVRGRVQALAQRVSGQDCARLILGAIRSRAESAGAEGEALLRATALLPCESSFEVLSAAAGLEEGAAIDAAEALMRARLIEEGRRSSRIELAPGLVRQAVIDGIDDLTRAAIHRRALAALESGPPGRWDPDPVLLAHHAWEGGDGAALRRIGPDAIRSLQLRGATVAAALWSARLAALT